MRKNISLLTLIGGFALLVAGAVILSSCEGPEGPAGPAGATGPAGPTGPAGADGADAEITCIECHNSGVVLFAKEQQAMSSHHLVGGNYGRNSADCARCHTHQGFVEQMETGTVAAAIDDPAPINCRTCHMIHETYTDDDWELVTEDPVQTLFGDFTIDLEGPSNLCVNCHQFRTVDPMPVAGGDSVTITSSRYGPHHGPQGNDLYGVGGYLIAGSKTYPDAGSHPHASLGCVGCHMAPVPYGGVTAGGHTLNMTYEYHGSEEDNIEGCAMCHSGIEDFDYHDVQTEIDSLVNEIATVFVAKGWIDAPGELFNTPLRLSADEAGAVLNYAIINDDGSHGVHNPAYFIALLTNTLESLQ